MAVKVLEAVERYEDEEDNRLQNLIERPFAYKLFTGAGLNSAIETFPVDRSKALDNFQLSSLVKFGISRRVYPAEPSAYYETLYGLSLKIMDDSYDWPLSTFVWIETLPESTVEKYPFLASGDEDCTVWKAVEFATEQTLGCLERSIRLTLNGHQSYPIKNDHRFDVILVGVHDEAQVINDLTVLYPDLKPDDVWQILNSRPSVISHEVDYATALDHAFVKLSPQAATCIIQQR